MSDKYEVGYGKPPKHTRFKKGESGNSRGRPRGHRNFETDLKATLDAPVRVKENGRSKTVTTQLATLMRLREKALGGDPRARDRLIELARAYNDEELTEAASATLAPADQAILDDFAGRARRRDQQPRTTDQRDSNQLGEQTDDEDDWLL